MENKNNRVQNPHDKFFKETWTNPEVARNFMGHYLPSEIVSAMNLDSLEICKDSFVTEELGEFFSDILYKIGIGDESGYVYFLFEHKSYPDAGIHFQLLQYIVEIWRQHRKENKSGKLPPIIPLVLYHSEKRWEVDTKFSSAVILPNENFLQFVPDFSFILYDLSRYTDEDIKGEILLKVALLVMKHIFDEELAPKLPGIFGLFVELISKDTGLKYIETLLKYILSGTESVNEKDLASALNQVAGPKGEAIIMTAAERLMQIGREEGIQQGMQQGILKGSVESLAEGLELAISIKFGEAPETKTAMDIIRSIDDPSRLRDLKHLVKDSKNIKELLASLIS
ncbi:Rpn family recombination-promoting nuclease/putative transposase [Desulforegula conservatrix]|uniref:Rpn family recombination-promoting nuclease/putative transposase n=1 Tax=Desulforegula conservatrix TaxID=153026 RepID=UPI000419BD52|nr:Rpn family recombination-promoting nuclease/putative transposase [Desulforegula conservatrix]